MLARSHNQHLLALLNELFQEAELKPVDVNLIAFGCGPGSFTGVRISAAAVQAIAVAAEAKVVPISSSWVLAATALQQRPQCGRMITSVRSRGDAYYLAAYEGSANSCENVVADTLVEATPAWFEEAFDTTIAANICVVGELPAWLPKQYHTHVLDELQPAAQVMVEFAQRQHEQGLSREAGMALPTYIAGDSPWRKQSQR